MIDPDELFGVDHHEQDRPTPSYASEVKLQEQAETATTLNGFQPDIADEESEAEDLAHMITLLNNQHNS